MDRMTWTFISIACSIIAYGYASRSIENFPEIAQYIDIAIAEATKNYEVEIDRLQRQLDNSKRKFEKEIADLKKQAESAEEMYTKAISSIRTEIEILEDKVCPAQPNNKSGAGFGISNSQDSDLQQDDEETQTQNSKRDLESIEAQTNYYKEHASEVPVPRFLTVQNMVVVNEGELAKLRCRIENLGTKMVSWRKTTELSPLTTGEDTFSPDLRIEVDHQEISETVSEWDLIIHDVRKKHAGIYECQISATDGFKMNVTLQVLDPKKYKPVITLKGTEYVSLSEKVRLKCNVTGAMEAPSRVDWFHEGDPMDQVKPKWYGRLQVLDRKPKPGRSYISEIILEQVTMADRGNYVCRSGKLAEGFKVHVLNDIRPYSEDPNKREVDDQSSSIDGSRYTMDTSDTSTHRHSIVLISVLYILVYMLSLR